MHESFSVDSIEEQIESRTSLLADEKLVHVLEELSLDLLQIFYIVSEDFLRDVIQLSVQGIEIVLTCSDVIVQQCDFFLFFF